MLQAYRNRLWIMPVTAGRLVIAATPKLVTALATSDGPPSFLGWESSRRRVAG